MGHTLSSQSALVARNLLEPACEAGESAEYPANFTQHIFCRDYPLMLFSKYSRMLAIYDLSSLPSVPGICLFVGSAIR